MNVYIIEIKASLKEENKEKRLVSSLARWDRNSPLYYTDNCCFELTTKQEIAQAFFDKRAAIRMAKRINSHQYSRLIINEVKILTVKLVLATPFDVRYSQIIER